VFLGVEDSIYFKPEVVVVVVVVVVVWDWITNVWGM